MTVPELTSTANPRVKAVVRLRDRRARDATGLAVVDGVREIGRAMDAGVEVVEAFASGSLATSVEARALLARLAATGRPATEVAEPVLVRIAFGDRTDGIVAVIRTPRRTLADIALPRPPAGALVAVVEGVEKPGNLGAILRSADGAGLDAVIAADPRTDLANPNVIRASLGTVFARPVVEASTADTLAWLREQGLTIVAARVDGAVDYAAQDLRGPVAIVLGAEVEGLSEAWRAPDIRAVRLPMLGVADSLNVSATAAVLFYEARRQRGTPSMRRRQRGTASVAGEAP
jgi:TrmH family RNA methyltransferase